MCCCREDSMCTFREGLFSSVVQGLVSPCFCCVAGCSVRPKQAFHPALYQLCVTGCCRCGTCGRCKNRGLWSHPLIPQWLWHFPECGANPGAASLMAFTSDAETTDAYKTPSGQQFCRGWCREKALVCCLL